MRMGTKKVSDSAVNNQIFGIYPGDLNEKGTLFGGRAMEMLDEVAGYVAMNHGNCICFTKRCHVEFFSPARIGDALIFKASVNRVWETSMEVGVKAFAKNMVTGETRHVLSGYSTLVTVSNNGQPIPVSQELEPVTEEEKRRYEEADLRRQLRFRSKRP